MRDARARKGLSQRALGERTGVPQAHISKIEQGRVDIRLSSLIEIARALELDVQLLPRRALHVVEGAVRAVEAESEGLGASLSRAALTRQERNLASIRQVHPGLDVEPILQTISTLKLLDPGADTSEALERALKPIGNAILARESDRAKLARALDRSNRSLKSLRNALAHRRPAEAAARLPAYRLDENDDE